MPKNILVADEDQAMLDLYLRMFRKTGYLVSRASSFEEAMGLIDSNSYEPVRHKQFRLQLPLLDYAFAPLNSQPPSRVLVSRHFGSSSKSSISP